MSDKWRSIAETQGSAKQKVEAVNMPRSHRADAFFLVVVDLDNRVFTVEGPMIDDTRWNKAVVRAQDAGRRLKCCNGGGDLNQAISVYRQAYGLRFVESGSVVRPTIDD